MIIVPTQLLLCILQGAGQVPSLHQLHQCEAVEFKPHHCLALQQARVMRTEEVQGYVSLALHHRMTDLAPELWTTIIYKRDYYHHPTHILFTTTISPRGRVQHPP